MTDRYKGFLVTLTQERRSDDCDFIINALEMVKGVASVKPYVNGMEDWMMYEKGIRDARAQILKSLNSPIKPEG